MNQSVNLEATLGELSKVIAPFGEAVAQVVPAVAPVLDVFKALNPEIAGAVAAIATVAPAIHVLTNPLGAVKDAIADVAGKLKEAFAAVYEVAATITKQLSTLVQSLAHGVAEFVRFSLSMQSANALMGAAAQGIQALTSSMTAGLSALQNAITPFLQAINPALMLGLNYAFRSIHATIGTALVPVARVLTSAFHQLARILMPAMQAIRPALGSLAEALMTFVKGTFRVFADTLVMIAPLLEKLGEVATILVGAMDSVRALVLAVADTMLNWAKSLFGGAGDAGDFKGFLASCRDGLHMAIGALLKFTVMLAKTLGLSNFQADLVRNLKDLAGERPGERKTGAPPAATDVAFRGFEDFAKTIAQSAFIAQGGAGGAGEHEKSEREWLAKLASDLADIKDGKAAKEYFAEFQKWLESKAETYGSQAGNWITGQVSRWWDELVEKASDRTAQGWHYVQSW